MRTVTDWITSYILKWNKAFNIIIKTLLLILAVAYVIYFLKFGFDFSQTTTRTPLGTILMGILFPLVAIVIFFIFHFSGERNFNLKLLGLPIGLAIGGTIIGLVGGLIHGITGWMLGGIVGIVMIVFTFKFYLNRTVQ